MRKPEEKQHPELNRSDPAPASTRPHPRLNRDPLPQQKSYPTTAVGWEDFILAKEDLFAKPCACGGHLVIKINRKAQIKFLGCNNFPRCRYTETACLEEVMGSDASQAYNAWREEEKGKADALGLDQALKAVVAANIEFEILRYKVAYRDLVDKFLEGSSRNVIRDGHC